MPSCAVLALHLCVFLLLLLVGVLPCSFGFTPGIGAVELYVEKVRNRGLCAQAQAESLRYKLLRGLQVRRACYGVMRYVMENGAKGCEVVVSGKLRAQRAKVMKFKDGYMIKTGQVCDGKIPLPSFLHPEHNTQVHSHTRAVLPVPSILVEQRCTVRAVHPPSLSRVVFCSQTTSSLPPATS